MIEDLKNKVNGDTMLVKRGRFLTTSFLLEVGSTAWLIGINEGQVVSITKGPFVMPSWSFATFQSSACAAEVASATVKPHSTAIRCSEPIVLFLIVEVPFLNTSRGGHLLPPAEQADRFFTAAAANLGVGRESRAHRRAFSLAENVAQVFDRQLHATFSRRFALRHSGNR